jgi:hypothetical protein
MGPCLWDSNSLKEKEEEEEKKRNESWSII